MECGYLRLWLRVPEVLLVYVDDDDEWKYDNVLLKLPEFVGVSIYCRGDNGIRNNRLVKH